MSCFLELLENPEAPFRLFWAEKGLVYTFRVGRCRLRTR